MDSSGQATGTALPPYTPKRRPPPYQTLTEALNTVVKAEQVELVINEDIDAPDAIKEEEEPFVSTNVPDDMTAGAQGAEDDLASDMGFTLIELD